VVHQVAVAVVVLQVEVEQQDKVLLVARQQVKTVVRVVVVAVQSVQTHQVEALVVTVEQVLQV
jgi:hypothetical protein